MTPNGDDEPSVPAHGRAAWSDGLVRGLLAFAVVFGSALALVLLTRIIAPTGSSPRSSIGIAGVALEMFHRVAIEMRPRGPTLFAVRLVVGVAPLAGTGLALFVCWIAGRGIAERAGGDPGRRVLAAMTIAPSYAMASLVLGSLVRIEGGGLLAQSVRLRPVVWQTLVFPLVLAAGAAASGALWTVRSDVAARSRWWRWAVGWVSAGSRMFALALGLAFLGVLVLAAVRPDGTRAYGRFIAGGGGGYAGDVLGGSALALPNLSVWVLAPSMGGCDTIRGGGASVDLLCSDRLPRVTSADGWLGRLAPLFGGRSDLGSEGALTRSRAPGYLLFALVPLAATILGGWSAGMRWGIGSRGDRVLVGAVGGLVFAMLVGATALVGSVFLKITLAGGSSRSLVIGPRPWEAFALAVAWGTLGGAIGGFLAGRGRDRSKAGG